jgi:hypothetical protein
MTGTILAGWENRQDAQQHTPNCAATRAEKSPMSFTYGVVFVFLSDVVSRAIPRDLLNSEAISTSRPPVENYAASMVASG